MRSKTVSALLLASWLAMLLIGSAHSQNVSADNDQSFARQAIGML
ncbi:MAG: hypothetical protein U1F52_02590 [Burkholderiales bacterium]